MDSIKMFKEIGFPDELSRIAFNRKYQFDYNDTQQNPVAMEIITSPNTKVEELCPTGTKLEKN